MEQIFPGGRLDATVIDTGYYNLNGGGVNTVVWRQMVSADGYIKELRVITSIAPGLGKEYNFTVELNGVLTLLTVKIAGAVDTSGVDMTNRVLVAPGDTLALYVSMIGAPVAPEAKWCSVFESLNAKESLLLCGSKSVTSTTVSWYNDLGGGQNWTSAVVRRETVVSANGVIRDLYIELVGAPGIGTSYTFTVYKNNAATGLHVHIANADLTGNDTADADAITVVPGDTLYVRCTPTGAVATFTSSAWGCLFVAAIDGESLVMGNVGSNILDILNVTHYDWINTGGITITAHADATINRLIKNCLLSCLYVALYRAPNAGASYTFMLRKGSADTLLTCQIAGAVDTTGNDTTNTIQCLDDEVINMEIENAGAPIATNYAWWGLKMFIQPKGIKRKMVMVRKIGMPTPINMGTMAGV